MNSAESKRGFVRNLSDNHIKQISILQALSKEPATTTANPRQYHFNEIARHSGLSDEKELQRCLFILEGQKLVEPYPAGDFTSKTWHITRRGLKAIKSISETRPLQ